MRSRAVWMAGVAACSLLLAGVRSPVEAQPVVSLEGGHCDIAGLTNAELASCEIQKHNVANLKVNRVTVCGRWFKQGGCGPWAKRAGDLPLKPGQALTPTSLAAAMEELARLIDIGALNTYFETQGEVAVLHISVNFSQPPDANTIDVELVPRYVNLSLVKVGDNVLPIPRLNQPKPADQIPAVLKWLNPSIAADYDRAFGTSVVGGIRMGGDRSEPRRLELAADGRVSTDESLHNADVALNYEWKKEEGVLRGATVGVGYANDREPLAEQVSESDARTATVGAMWKLAPGSRLFVDGAYRSTHDALLGEATASIPETSGDSHFARVLYEAIPPTLGFVRASLWGGTTSVGGGIDESFQTAILRVGYEREFSLKPGSTVGVEILAGGGRIWGNAPAYARFFGGSSPTKFLYDGATSQAMVQPPAGPLLRSFGQGGAALRTAGGAAVGGTRFWHVNVNITAPIPGLSKPLIPDEDLGLTGSDGEPVGLKELMQTQVEKTGTSMLEGTLVAQGMSAADASARAASVMGEIIPAARYIIRDANVFALKPLIVLDAAGLSGDEGSASWLSAGAGLQLTVVTARFEAGYARTVHGPTFGNRGAAFARLTFQRLF